MCSLVLSDFCVFFFDEMIFVVSRKWSSVWLFGGWRMKLKGWVNPVFIRG